MHQHEPVKFQWVTPGNIITAIILGVGFIITAVRFTQGIGSVTNLDDNFPWGMWIAFDLLCGVCLAAGGYFTSSACYLFGMKRFHSAVRPAILTAFLGYSFVVVALLYDLGHPLRLPYPLFYSPGTTSVLYEVGLCVACYVTVLFVEFSPAAMEWINDAPLPRFLNWVKRIPWKSIRKVVVYWTLPLTILGVCLSTMHQSSLGALFLIAPGKLHPLWYSPFIPVFFFISSMVAGPSMVIFEGMFAHAALHHKMDETHLREADDVTLSFGKAASWILLGLFMIRVMDVAMSNNWAYLCTGYGTLFLVEMLGGIALPALIYALGTRKKSVKIMRVGAVIAVLGIVLNRFNVCIVAFQWQLPSAERYFPSIWEVCISIFVVTLIVTTYRFIAWNMPILYEHPDYKEAH
jgi:Ni/Fe-hydrogenase subunit HybB-like protein